MRPFPLHKRPIRLARFLCLTLMLALLTNPVLAVVATSLDCNGKGCCCVDMRRSPTVKISDNSDMDSTCCSPVGAMPCHVTTNRLPDAPLALIQAVQRGTADTIHLIPSGFNAALNPEANHLSILGIDTDAVIPTSPIYLQSCRFIC